MGIGEWIDRAIAPFAPRLALRRRKARLQMSLTNEAIEWMGLGRAYEAARRNRSNGDRLPPTMSANQTLADGPALTAWAREGVRNNPYADSISQAHRRNLGYITPRAVARGADGKLATEFNRALDVLWRRWATRARFVDVEGKKSFYEFQGLAAEELCAAGEAFWLWSYQRRGPVVGLTLQAIEPEQFSTLRDRNPGNGNRIDRGIELDEFGRAVAYWIHPGAHPLEGLAGEPERVDASRVIHLMRQRRVRQAHGVTRIASALPGLYQLAKLDEAELFACWMEACQGIILPDDGGDDEAIGYTGSGGELGESGKKKAGQIEFRPGMVVRNKDAKPFSPQHPNSQYEPFTRKHLRLAAAAGGFSYATVARHVEGSYSAARQEAIEEWKELDPLQELVISQALQPVRELFVAFAVLEGRLPIGLAEYAADPLEWAETEWQPVPRRSVDPARDAAARKIDIDYRLTDRSSLANAQGVSQLEVFESIAEERDAAAALGITLPENAAGGPAASPREPKVHGAGEDEENGGTSGGSGRADDELVNQILANAIREN